MSTNTTKPAVYLVDDDKSIRDALRTLFKGAGMHLVGFASAEEFLEAVPENPVGCLLLDVILPEMGGMELMHEMEKLHIVMPVLLLTGHADVSLAVQAIRGGAFDVIEKPFKDKRLIERVRQAMSLSVKWKEVEAERKEVAERLERLTRRERQVMALMCTGMKNRMIAEEMGISRKTLDIHRSKVMNKMEARTVADLVRWAYLDNPGLLPVTTPLREPVTP